MGDKTISKEEAIKAAEESMKIVKRKSDEFQSEFPIAQLSRGKMLICPTCGLEVHGDFDKCPRCGAEMVKESGNKE